MSVFSSSRALAAVVMLGIVIGPGPAARAADDRAAAGLLFAKGSGGLSDTEQLEIFRALGLRVSDDGKGLVDDACGQPLVPDVQFPDLNADGVIEVLVTYGNACMSGLAGSSVALFVKDTSSHYRLNLGFPGMIAEVTSTMNQGHPDLVIGGPGFCFPVWRWDGKEYVHHRNQPQSPGGCDHLEK